MRRISLILFQLLLLSFFLQLGKHFWLSESLVLGRRVDYLSPTLYISDVLLFLLGFTVWFRTKNLKVITIGGMLFLSLSLFYFWLTRSLLVFYFELKLLEWLLLIWLIYKIRPSSKDFIIPITLGIIVTTALGVTQFLTQSSLNGAFYWLGERTFNASTPGIAQVVAFGRIYLRPYATFPHPNVWGGFLVALLPFYFATNQGDKKNYILKHSGLVAAILGITISFSRNAWLVAVGIGCFYVHQKLKNQWNKILLICLIGLSFFVWEESTLGRFKSLSIVDIDSIQERRQLTDLVLPLWSSSPLVGIGPGQFIRRLPVLTSLRLFQPVHSIYLLILVEYGIVGGVLLGTVLIKAGRKTLNDHSPIVYSLIAIGLLGVFDHYFVTLQQTQLLFTFLLGMAFYNSDS